jgi:hypothetical protein
MSKLSPVASLVQRQGINLNPPAQKGLLKYALNKKPEGAKSDSDSGEDDADVSKFQSKKASKEERSRRQ